jgi:hypothetical protein
MALSCGVRNPGIQGLETTQETGFEYCYLLISSTWALETAAVLENGSDVLGKIKPP